MLWNLIKFVVGTALRPLRPENQSDPLGTELDEMSGDNVIEFPPMPQDTAHRSPVSRCFCRECGASYKPSIRECPICHRAMMPEDALEDGPFSHRPVKP